LNTQSLCVNLLKAKIGEEKQLQAILRKNSLNCGGKLLFLDQPKVMGILNTTPDSFYEQSRVGNSQLLIDRAGKMLEDGAAILDIGGQSTRPGAEIVGVEEELTRLLPAIQLLKSTFPEAILSVDTFYAAVALASVSAGASMVNDVSGGEDPAMFQTISNLQVPYVLMHRPGNSLEMQQKANYDDVVLSICNYFSSRLNLLRALGVADVVLDPGFGFGKLLAHNYELLKNLEAFKIFELPLMIGVSRKKMVQQVVNKDASGSLNGTTAAHMAALLKGANLLRVHDVAEAKECIDIFMAIEP
jgi:dihydropteroate synthase